MVRQELVQTHRHGRTWPWQGRTPQDLWNIAEGRLIASSDQTEVGNEDEGDCMIHNVLVVTAIDIFAIQGNLQQQLNSYATMNQESLLNINSSWPSDLYVVFSTHATEADWPVVLHQRIEAHEHTSRRAKRLL